MELGIHNSTLAIAVAGTIDIDLAIPAAVYSGFMFITAGLFARFMAKREGARAGAGSSAGLALLRFCTAPARLRRPGAPSDLN